MGQITFWLVALLFYASYNHCKNIDSSSAEITAGNAISKLLQEKISMKFKEAANEVKGVLVKHLGDSLKNAHNRMNPKKRAKKIVKALKARGLCDEECRFKKLSHRAKCYACKPHFTRTWHQGAAAVHQNKGPRNRKNSGPVPGKASGQNTGPYGMGMSGGQQSQQQQQQSGAPGQPIAALAQRPGTPQQPGQCGPQCSPTCAPTCDTQCCQTAGCPPACQMSCFSYCPPTCCTHKKNTIPLKKNVKAVKE